MVKRKRAFYIRTPKAMNFDFLQKYGKLCTFPEHMERVPLENFNKNKQSADGYHAYCKACRKKIRDKWYEANREQILKKNKEW